MSELKEKVEVVETTNEETLDSEKTLSKDEYLKKKFYEAELKRIDRNERFKKKKFTMKEKQEFVKNLVRFKEGNSKDTLRKNTLVKTAKKQTKKLTKEEQLEKIKRIKNTLKNNSIIPAMFAGSMDVFNEKLNKTEDELKKIIAIEKAAKERKAKETEQTAQ